MLDSLRKSANSWLAKLLLGLVALSFVAWGVERRSTGLGGQPYVATVGSTPITDQEFVRAYERQIDDLSRRAQRRVTSEEARAYGVDRGVLSRLVGETALDNQAKQLGLALSDETLAENLKREPGFQGPDGKFDRSAFEGWLSNNRLTERGFFALKRQADVREQLTSSLVAAVVTPKPIIEAVHTYKQETRIIEHFSLDADKAVTIPEPDTAKLKETYTANKLQFMAPEYRKLQIMLLSVDELKKDVPIGEAEIAAAYEASKDSYATPELRRIQRIPFKDKAEATAAKAAIDGGKNFMTIGQERGLKDNEIELGLMGKKSIKDRKLAEAAFSIDKDKVSDVVASDLAYVLLRVPEIKPGKQSTLDEVKDRVRDKLARAKAKEEVAKLREKVDDLRNEAKTDTDIAGLLKLKVVEVAATDNAGKTPEGKPALELPDAAKLVAAGFDAKAGLERDAVDLADGGYGWVGSLGATAARQKTYEEVEADVKTLHIANERKAALFELTGKLIERLGKGETMEALATELAAKLEKTLAITRATVPQGLTEAAVKQAFAVPQGKAGSAETADKKSRTLFRVAEVKAAEAASKEQADALSKEISQQIAIDSIDAYVAALQEAGGVKINDAELRRLVGSGGQ
jgi:peptidyl-prolyl cis-trans isomerase D